MKTRYFKSGILAAAAALLYSAAFVSCTDDVTVGEWDGAGSIETGLNETGAVLQDLNSGKSNTTVELWKETYTAELRLVLTKAPAEGFTLGPSSIPPMTRGSTTRPTVRIIRFIRPTR